MKITNKQLTIMAVLLLSVTATSPGLAQSPVQSVGPNAVPVMGMQSDFTKFTPRPYKGTKIDYRLMDEVLSYMVLDLGPSLRSRMSKPQATTGTRFVQGHTSPYRMEGSRVTFDYVTESFLAGLTEYRKDLEAVGTQVDIARLSKNEQLAYWFNLHNLALLEQIALAYPVGTPSKIKVKSGVGKTSLDDAKILNVSGQALSLRDIRENIVYKNWSDPSVIYGFYRGDIGSPKLARSAFAANRMDFLMEENAAEFVNSLRGFRKGTKYRYVSEIYKELDGSIFKNFDADLENHLAKYAQDNVLLDVKSSAPFKFDRYEDDIADLTNGRRLASSGNALLGNSTIPKEVQRFVAESNTKREILINRGLITPRGGYVIIEDLVPEDEKPSE